MVPEVTLDEGVALVERGALLLDVRETEEWVAGHAVDARWVPMADVPAAIESLPRDRDIVAVCRSGGRSARVTEYLCAQGLRVVNLAGGMKAWEAAGHSVITDDGAFGAVV